MLGVGWCGWGAVCVLILVTRGAFLLTRQHNRKQVGEKLLVDAGNRVLRYHRAAATPPAVPPGHDSKNVHAWRQPVQECGPTRVSPHHHYHTIRPRVALAAAPEGEGVHDGRLQLQGDWSKLPLWDQLDTVVKLLTAHQILSEDQAEMVHCITASAVLALSRVAKEAASSHTEGPLMLPLEHVCALVITDLLLEHARQTAPELAAVVRHGPRKNGLSRHTRTVVEDRQRPTFGVPLLLSRCAESVARSLSETVLACALHARMDKEHPDTFSTAAFFLKSITEHASVRDRHPALLIATRGFCTPHRSPVALAPYTYASPPLHHAFTTAFPHGSSPTARALFPFLEVPARVAAAGRRPPEPGLQSGIVGSVIAAADASTTKALMRWAVDSLHSAAVAAGGGSSISQLHQTLPPPLNRRGTTAHDLCHANIAIADGQACRGRKKARERFHAEVATFGRFVLLVAAASVTDEDALPALVARASLAQTALAFNVNNKTPSQRRLLSRLHQEIPAGDVDQLVCFCDDAIRSVLDATNGETGDDRAGVAHTGSILSTGVEEWNSPQLLLTFVHMHRHDPPVHALASRVARAILFDDHHETLDFIRYRDPANIWVSAALGPAVAADWVVEGRLPGSVNPESLFRCGEVSGTCLAIRWDTAGQNKAILGYLAQGNVRMVTGFADGVSARAIVRVVLEEEREVPAATEKDLITGTDLTDAEMCSAEAQPGWSPPRAVLWLESVYVPEPRDSPAALAAVEAMMEEAGALAMACGLPLFSLQRAQSETQRLEAEPGRAAVQVRAVEPGGLSPVIYSDTAKSTRGSGLWRRRTANSRVLICEWSRRKEERNES